METVVASQNEDSAAYEYRSVEHRPSHSYLLPELLRLLESSGSRKVFELGCGNGAIARALTQRGYDVTAVDRAPSGIDLARQLEPELKLFCADVYDPLAGRFGTFPLVISLEVIEHLYYPRKLITASYDLLENGGTLILSTPFHGYWKNVALAISGSMDKHFMPLLEGGHIKFWSEATLRLLLVAGGFSNISFTRVGRIPALAKSMFAVARKQTC